MSVRGLHSDHINLLIFRYLQEVGFETSANAFHRDWHRPADCHDPEHLPFAHQVHRNELISVIQTGLYHDDLQSRVRKAERRFRWSTTTSTRESVERRDVAGDGSVISGNKRKAAPSTSHAADEFSTTVLKAQRRSEGSDAQTNDERDAMSVDAATPSADADADDDGDVPSPTIQSDPEQIEVVERYDSMDVATQTEIKTTPKTSTMYWKIEKPEASIFNCIWNPDSNKKNAKTLLAVGHSLCRFYQVPDLLDDVRQVSHVDDPSLPAGCTVSATAWRPDGQGASCATVGIRQLPDESSMERQFIVELNRQGSIETLQLGPPQLDPAGIVLALQYSPNQQYLMAARTNRNSSLVQIWKAPQSSTEGDKSQVEPIAWHIFETTMLEAVWTRQDAFAVCGERGLSAQYQIDLSHQPEIGVIAAGTVAMRGLIPLNSNILSPTVDWDKVRFDARHGLAVFAAAKERRFCVTRRLCDSNKTSLDDVYVEIADGMQTLAWRSSGSNDDRNSGNMEHITHSLLAVAFVDGSCSIYSVTSSDSGINCALTASITLLDGPALSLAWSPDGEYLAVSNAELVQIWTADSMRLVNGESHHPQSSIIWRPAFEANGLANGDHVSEQSLNEPSLSWRADGASLAFATEKQIAIMQFRPASESAVNGGELHHKPSP